MRIELTSNDSLLTIIPTAQSVRAVEYTNCISEEE